jgi:histidine triad (HIT) family protein
MSSIFSQIIMGKISSFKIYEDDLCVVILDVFPISYGHSLVIPKQEINNWLDCPQDLYLHLQKVAYNISKVINDSVDCLRVGMMIDGRQVPHLHIHLIPIHVGKGLTEKSCPNMQKIDFEELLEQIKSNLNKTNLTQPHYHTSL